MTQTCFVLFSRGKMKREKGRDMFDGAFFFWQNNIKDIILMVDKVGFLDNMGGRSDGRKCSYRL
jgi:hypothetical protein